MTALLFQTNSTGNGTSFQPVGGNLLNGATVATFTDQYTGAPAAAFSAVIDWGDGSTSAGTVRGSDGVYSVAGCHTYLQSGPYPIGVAITEEEQRGRESIYIDSRPAL